MSDMIFDSIIDFVEALTLLKVLVACCISMVSLIALFFASHSDCAEKHTLTVALPVMTGLIANAVFTVITLLISVSWGAAEILRLVGAPDHTGEWIAILAIGVVMWGVLICRDR
jgi:hypothetical protein